MHEKPAIFTDVSLFVTRLKLAVGRAVYAVCVGSFDAANALLLIPLHMRFCCCYEDLHELFMLYIKEQQ